VDPAALAWVAHDTRLISCCLAAILSILIGTFIAGLGAGLPAEAVAKAFSKGAGGILGEAGIIIALGSMLGALMAESGAADRIASTLLGLGKGRSLPWVMALVAMVIGLPLFFEVGLVLMVPIIFVMAQRSGQPLLRIAIPALARCSSATSTTPASGWCASTSAWSSSRRCGSGRCCRRWFPSPASRVRYCCRSGSS